MKKISDYEGTMFKYYELTDLMLLEKKGRKVHKKILDNTALHELLNQMLEEYGIQLFGQFDRNDMRFRGIRLLKGFPIENEPLIHQLYGYEDFEAYIQLDGFYDFATAFIYNTSTQHCELQRHRWGVVTNRKNYYSLANMIEQIGDRTEESYNKIFKL